MKWHQRLDAAVLDAPTGSAVRRVIGALGIVIALAALPLAVVLGLISLIYGYEPGLAGAGFLLLLAVVAVVLSLPNLRRRRTLT